MTNMNTKTLVVLKENCPQNHPCPSVPICPVNALKQTGVDAPTVDLVACIRCGKCVDACPMGLEPYLLATLSANNLYDRLENEGVTSCMSCGSCQFTCPSHRPILDNILQGKGVVMGMIKARNVKK